jgi:hypothetical protein
MTNRELALSMGPWNVASLEIFMVGSGVYPLQNYCRWSGPGEERRMLIHERRISRAFRPSRATSRKIAGRGESCAGDATSQSRLAGTAHEASRQSKSEIIFLL